MCEHLFPTDQTETIPSMNENLSSYKKCNYYGIFKENNKYWSGFFRGLTCFHSKSKIISFVLSMYSANLSVKY
jgi:hypothetical protein